MADYLSAMLAVSSQDGGLNPIPGCAVSREGINVRVPLLALPELTTSKEATYASTAILGRSSPIVSYQHSGPRTVSMTVHCHALTRSDLLHNILLTQLLFSCVYPTYENSYKPPPLLTIDCGAFFKNVKCIVRNVEVGFSSEVVWDQSLMVPRQWDVTMTAEVVYSFLELPSSGDVASGKREIVVQGRTKS